MTTVVMDKKEEIVMKLVHFLVTKENYVPIVVNGVKNEVWLENDKGPYKIIRINSNHVHNDEQYKYDIFKINNISRQVKKKTLSFRMDVLNILLDSEDRVSFEDTKNIKTIKLNEDSIIEENNDLIDIFPNISDEVIDAKNGLDLIINATNDINTKTAKDNKEYQDVFTPKKIVVTYCLMGLCCLVFLLEMVSSNFQYMFFNHGGLVRSGEFYRVITGAFLHVDLIHLFFNMYALYSIGTQLETFIGKWKFLFVYIVSAISGCLMSVIFTPGFSAGASGAIFGLLGSLCYFGYHYRLYLSTVVKSQIIPIIIANLFLGYMISGIDNAAHIGGLIGGYLATMAVGINYKSTKSDIINGSIVLVLYLLFLIYIGIFKIV